MGDHFDELIKQEFDHEPENSQNDIKQSFYRTYQENNLDSFFKAEEIGLEEEKIKKSYLLESANHYMTEMKEIQTPNPKFNTPYTPIKFEYLNTPNLQKSWQKSPLFLNNSQNQQENLQIYGNFKKERNDLNFEETGFDKKQFLSNFNNDFLRNKIPLRQSENNFYFNSLIYKENPEHNLFEKQEKIEDNFENEYPLASIWCSPLKKKKQLEKKNYGIANFYENSESEFLLNLKNQKRNEEINTYEYNNNNNNYNHHKNILVSKNHYHHNPEHFSNHNFIKSSPYKSKNKGHSSYMKTPFKIEGKRDKILEDTPSRSSRGLRVLSLKVKEIVCNRQKATYKEVAECLIDELDLKSKTDEKSKDEQNIKRRVYDALNVLIAADILKKKGKQVFSDESSNFIGKNIKKNSIEEKTNLEQDIEERKGILTNKQQILQEILIKTLALKNLISRNKHIQENGLNEYDHYKIGEDDDRRTINFPFIVLELKNGENSTEITSNRQKTMMKVVSKDPYNIHGDMDILLKLGLFKTDRRKIDELLIKDLHRYLPEDIFENSQEASNLY